jgi:hypothetical protein
MQTASAANSAVPMRPTSTRPRKGADMVRSWHRKIKELLAPAFKSEVSSDRKTTMRKTRSFYVPKLKQVMKSRSSGVQVRGEQRSENDDEKDIRTNRFLQKLALENAGLFVHWMTGTFALWERCEARVSHAPFYESDVPKVKVSYEVLRSGLMLPE